MKIFPTSLSELLKVALPLVVFLVALLSTPQCLFGQRMPTIRRDDSDWWSVASTVVNSDLSSPQVNAQPREPEPSLLEIATIRAGSGEIDKSAARFGNAKIITRGDAALSRRQACYVSPNSKTYVIFEEDGEGFGGAIYLFEDGQRWNGRDLCATSPLIPESIAAGRLRLGLSVGELKAVLGKPSIASPNELRYVFNVSKTTSASKLKELRAQNRDLSDADFRDSFGQYFVTISVVAKFNASELNYLAVTRSESYP